VLEALGNHEDTIRNLLHSGGGGFSNVSFVLPHTLNTNLSVNQLLFDARYMFGIRARKDLAKTSRLSTSLTEQEIRYTITKAYCQAEAAQEAKSLLSENKKVIEKLLGDTKATFEQGLIEELDVNRLELAQATLESQINRQNQLAEVALSNLKFQMGLPMDEEIILKDKLDALKANANLSIESKFDAKSRPEYDLLSTAITLKGYDIAQKRSGYYPSLNGFLSYGWAAQTEKFGDIFKSEPSPDGSKINNWYSQGVVGIKLSIPIFDSGLKMAQVKQAKIEQLKSTNDFENFKNAAQLQFQVAQSGLNSAIADDAIAQKTLDLSQKIFSKNQIKFTEGIGSSFELEQSQQELTTNQLKYIQSIMNLLNAKADLDKAMGVK
jgi:outer membrane protein TolC